MEVIFTTFEGESRRSLSRRFLGAHQTGRRPLPAMTSMSPRLTIHVHIIKEEKETGRAREEGSEGGRREGISSFSVSRLPRREWGK